jgi:P27 family predicted phage terminase small subunit
MLSGAVSMRIAADLPKPPRHLQRPGRALWAAIQGDYRVEDAAGLALLLAACESRDRAEAAREEIAQAGMTFVDSKGNPRPHPLLTIERDSRAACVSALRALGLDAEPAGEVGRPPGGSKGKMALVRVG